MHDVDEGDGPPEVLELPGVGHALMEERGPEVAERVARFVDAAVPAGGQG
jgi:hypothetical protein